MATDEITDKKSKTATVAAVEYTIEELATRLNVKPWIMVGLKTANRWGAGKRLTEAEFIAARDAWLTAPMGR